MSQLWSELHRHAINHIGNNDIIFLNTFRSKMPRFTTGCRCKEFWDNYVRSHPPVFGPNKEYFKWTVDTHNAVNIKLGKPIFSLEDALTLYNI